MIAVRVSQEQRAAIAAAPQYFESTHARIAARSDKSPMHQHQHGVRGTYRWEFDRGSESLAVALHGPLVLDDMAVTIRAAMDGIGVAHSLEDMSRPNSRTARSCASSRSGAPRLQASSCTHPSRRQQLAALSALIETLRL